MWPFRGFPFMSQGQARDGRLTDRIMARYDLYWRKAL